LHTIIASISNIETLPTEDEVPNIYADEDADDKVSVIVHGQQHHTEREGKLACVQQCPNRLLHNSWPEHGRWSRATYSSRRCRTWSLVRTVSVGRRSRSRNHHWRRRRQGRSSLHPLLLGYNISIILLARATQKLEQDGQENDADAGAAEHGSGVDMPCRRHEARIEDVPVPEHLWASWMLDLFATFFFSYFFLYICVRLGIMRGAGGLAYADLAPIAHFHTFCRHCSIHDYYVL